MGPYLLQPEHRFCPISNLPVYRIQIPNLMPEYQPKVRSFRPQLRRWLAKRMMLDTLLDTGLKARDTGAKEVLMSDQLDTATPRPLLVDGRNPTADEAITVSDPAVLSVAPSDANGVVLVTGTADGTATITVAPGAADANRTAGSDDVTVVTSTPLVVSLG